GDADDEADEQRRPGAAPKARPEVLADGVGAEDELVARRHVAQRQPRVRVEVNHGRRLLVRQIWLNEGKGQKRPQQDQERHGHAVFQKHPPRGAPVRVVRVPRALRGFLVVSGERKQRFVDVIRRPVQRFGHYLLPSLAPSLMRGSSAAMSKSPINKPKMLNAEKISTRACTRGVSWR